VDAEPQTWACRLVFLTAYLTAALLSVAYSATFISILTVNRYKLPFTDIKEFSENGKYTLGMLPNSAQLSIFQVSMNLIHPEKYGFLGSDVVFILRDYFMTTPVATGVGKVSPPELFRKLCYNICF
jgi:hypothetical protein